MKGVFFCAYLIPLKIEPARRAVVPPRLNQQVVGERV
jgi:hypothetical protein